MDTDKSRIELVNLITAMTSDGQIIWDQIIDTYASSWRGRKLVFSWLRDEPPTLFVVDPTTSQTLATAAGRSWELRQLLHELEQAIESQVDPDRSQRWADQAATAHRQAVEREQAEQAELSQLLNQHLLA